MLLPNGMAASPNTHRGLHPGVARALQQGGRARRGGGDDSSDEEGEEGGKVSGALC
jgi:hypothetical protein